VIYLNHKDIKRINLAHDEFSGRIVLNIGGNTVFEKNTRKINNITAKKVRIPLVDDNDIDI
jgi:hypothetical protein